MQNNAIEINHLTKEFPKRRNFWKLVLSRFKDENLVVLDDVSISVGRGKCFFLLGPNGAGKTTLIKIISTLILPNKGAAKIMGMDVQKESGKIKSLIGYALNEERSFFLRLTGRQNLEFFAALNNIPEAVMAKRVTEALELTNLSEASDKFFQTYSSGMKQMMAFARALLTDAQIIIVDEPTRSLDPHAAKKVQKFLKEEFVTKRGLTVFWTSHNLHEVEEFGDELAIIRKGKIILSGSIKDLTKNNTVPLNEIYEKAVEGE